MKNLVLVIVVVALNTNTAQAQLHYNAWFRSTLSIPLYKKLKADLEFQHRRQNGYNNKKMLDRNLMFTLRSWIHYTHSKDIKISVSPLACFSHFPVIETSSGKDILPNKELRTSAAIELQHELFENFYIFDRNALEYRIFDRNNILRMRSRIGLSYELINKLKISLYEELFFNIKGVPTDYFFDHDRIGIFFEYDVFPRFRIDLGALHISRLSINNHNKLKEHNLLLNLTYIFNSRD